MSSTVAPAAPVSGTGLARTAHLRRRLVPLVAFLATSLGLTCLLNLADLAVQVAELSLVNYRFAGWAAVGAFTGMCCALMSLAAAPRLGVAVPLAAGSAAAVFGLALGGAVFTDVQLAVAMVVLGLAAGALLGAAGSLLLEPPGARRPLVALAVAVPMVAGIAVVDWLALHVSRNDTVRLALHPPVWPLAAASVVLFGWSAVTLLADADAPPPTSPHADGAESAWPALALAALLPAVAGMLLGFDPGIGATWLRPLVVVVAAATVLGLGFGCLAMPSASARSGYVAVVVALLCWPACISLVLLATPPAGAGSRSIVGLTVVGVAVGAGLAALRSQSTVVGGLLAVAVGAAGAWAPLGSGLLTAAPVALLGGGTAAALLGGLRVALAAPLGAQLVAAAAVCAAILGVLLSVPLSWALGGALPESAASARTDARVLLGLTFAAAVLGAGYAATLRPAQRPSRP